MSISSELRLLPGCRTDERRMTVEAVQHKEWFDSLHAIVQKGVQEGLFGILTPDRVIRRLFHDARHGWCHGVTQCLSANRIDGTPIIQTVQKTLAAPDRICCVQICTSLALTLLHPTTNQELFFTLCDQTCLHPESLSSQGNSATQRHLLQKAALFWKAHHISHPDDPLFVQEKFRLFHKLLKKNGCRDRTPRSVTIDSSYKPERARALADEVTSLKNRVLGKPLPIPVFECTIGSNFSREQQEGLFRTSASEIQCIHHGHIYSIFQEGERVYTFDSKHGLIQLPTTDARSCIKKVSGIRYKIFAR